MVKLFVFHTRDGNYEYWLRLKLDLLKGNKFIMQNGNLSFHVNSYKVDELYSSSNWADAFKLTKVCKLLTIEVASKKLKIDVEFSSNETSSFPER